MTLQRLRTYVTLINTILQKTPAACNVMKWD